MLTKEAFLREVAEHAPALMQKTASTLSALESRHPTFFPDTVQEINTITEHTLDKLASLGVLGRWGARVGTSIAAGIAADLAGDLYSSAKRGFTKGRNFEAIMKANPELKAIDKTRLRQSYDAIHRYAPELTADPLVGGAMLKSVAEVPGNEAVAIKSIIETRKNIVNPFRVGEGIDIKAPEPVDVKTTSVYRKQEAQLRATNDILRNTLSNITNDDRLSDRQRRKLFKANLKAFDKGIDATLSPKK